MKRPFTIIALTGLAASALFGAKSERLVMDQAESQRPAFNKTWQGFPPNAATPEQASILIEKEVPATVKPGAAFSFDIKVTNRSSDQIDSLVLTEQLPDGFELIEANPEPERRGRSLQWSLSMLAPGQVEFITITGKGTKPGTLAYQGNSALSFDLRQTTAIVAVIQPGLDLFVSAPETVLIGDLVPVEVRFTNSGTATVTGAKVSHTLPKGLVTSDGLPGIELVVGTLQPGETKTFNLNLKAQKTGRYSSTFKATADAGLVDEAQFDTTVQQPKLKLFANAPARRFVGNVVPVEFTVENTGDGDARYTEIRQTMPNGVVFESADEGGVIEQNEVIWRIGTLQPGEKKTVSARFVAKEITKSSAHVLATANAAEVVRTQFNTEVGGIAAILLELEDVNDPVLVGETETYTVRATNQGSLAGSNIVIKCVLEDGMQYVSSAGPTKGTIEGNVLSFEPIASLAPNTEAVWKVIIKALDEGDVRFTASIESEQLTRPVVENEATNFYK